MLSGRAEPLLLLLWKRVAFTDHDFEVTGDREVADRVLAAALTP